MWKSTVQKNDNGTYNATAQYVEKVDSIDNVVFSWASTIKDSSDEIEKFVAEAKKSYIVFQENHKEDDNLKSEIDVLLNK